ncbi:MAG: hypothetical protein KKI09_11090 [Spirochaetes bacterium]|nr:hypothetical protein [Spirochaetota bacterium]MBU0955961.1 hypothetical protein [Spirochaetota bacterium]
MAARTPELPAVLDFILNHASEAELEVVTKALQRRRQDMGRFAAMGGLNPGAMASRMASSINEGIQGSMESLRRTVRSYVEELIRRNAPEATEAQVEALLDHYVGQAEASVLGRSRNSESEYEAGGPGLVDMDGRIPDSGLPADAQLMMVRDFCDYSLGMMPAGKQQELWEWMSNWQDLYWDAFPPALKSLIKARLEERLDEEAFWRAVLTLLGL